MRDYGPGISPEHLPRLTERFYRVDVSESRAQGGTGLGLALVKHILNRHGGRLTIESVLGQGATFTTHLPLADVAAGKSPAGRQTVNSTALPPLAAAPLPISHPHETVLAITARRRGFRQSSGTGGEALSASKRNKQEHDHARAC